MQNITVLDWLEDTAGRFPDKAAFMDGERTLSFSEVREAAMRIGCGLIPFTAPRSPVIVLSGRHVYTPVCFLGVVYSGCFYVPLDASMPGARLNQILSVLGSDPGLVMITDRTQQAKAQELSFTGRILLLEDLLGCGDGTSGEGCDLDGLREIRMAMSSDQPLYTIFTSGSTGVPKGVVTSHGALMTYIEAISGVLSIDSQDRLANQSPLDYIAAVRDIYLPLRHGASTVILPKKYTSMSASLFAALNQYRVTTLCWSVAALEIPVKMRTFEAEQPEYLRKVCFSGSVMPGSVLRVWQEHLPDALFVNQYGPTETTASCTYYVVEETATDQTVLPIGVPFPQYRILLLNGRNQETAPGEIGEICVLGPTLALGYYGNPELTAASFPQNPLNSLYQERIYRTGDLGRLREDGLLEFHGRMDRQIKHLGHRIELGELEQIAGSVEGVDECCALYQKEKELLYLFYSGAAGQRDITLALRKLLPGFMIPRRFCQLKELPRLPNGKTDMKALEQFYTNENNN